MSRLTARFAASAAAALITATTLAGCTAGASDSSLGGGMAAEPQSVDSQAFEGQSFDEQGATTEQSTADADGRQVVTTGALVITAEDPVEASVDAATIVETAGGRVDSRRETPAIDENSTPSASLLARIPSSALTEALADIRELGEVEDLTLDEQDVTATTTDLDARITALQSSTDRLLALLAGSTETTQLIRIEAALSERQGELERLQAQRRGLADQVDFATISIDFTSEAVAPIDQPDDFVSGLGAGIEGLVTFVGGALVIIGVLLPWFTVLAIIVGVVVALVRARRRTSRSGETPSRTAVEPDAVGGAISDPSSRSETTTETTRH